MGNGSFPVKAVTRPADAVSLPTTIECSVFGIATFPADVECLLVAAVSLPAGIDCLVLTTESLPASLASFPEANDSKELTVSNLDLSKKYYFSQPLDKKSAFLIVWNRSQKKNIGHTKL